MYGYSRGHRLLEIIAITVFFATEGILGIRLAQGVDRPDAALGLALAALAGFILSDFISGVVHWAGDTLGDEGTPFLGPHFVKPFRLHHVDPQAICRHDFIETNGNNCIVAAPVLVVVACFVPPHTGGAYYTAAVIAFLSFFVLCTNQFHKWAHANNPPPVYKVLQALRLALGTRHHAKHHAPPHDKYYCITVGWLNPVLTKIRFFRGLEWLVARARPDLLHIEERSRPVPATTPGGKL